MNRLVLLAFMFLILCVGYVKAIGVAPAKVEKDLLVGVNHTINLWLFNTENVSGYYVLVPDENVSQVLVEDCNYWCSGKTYWVEGNTFLTEGTLVQLLFYSNVSRHVYGKIGVYPYSESGGMVGVVGGVAASFDLDFYEETPQEEEDSTTTTTTTSTTTTSTTTTTIHQTTTSTTSVRYRTRSRSSSHKRSTFRITTTTTTTTTTIPKSYVINVGVAPAKIYIQDEANITVMFWNSAGNVDAIFIVEPDSNCSLLLNGEFPAKVLVPMNTTRSNPVKFNLSFKKPYDSFECGINVIGRPANYSIGGVIRVKSGVKIRVFSVVPEVPTNVSAITVYEGVEEGVEEEGEKINPVVVGVTISGIAIAAIIIYLGHGHILSIMSKLPFIPAILCLLLISGLVHASSQDINISVVVVETTTTTAPAAPAGISGYSTSDVSITFVLNPTKQNITMYKYEEGWQTSEPIIEDEFEDGDVIYVKPDEYVIEASAVGYSSKILIIDATESTEVRITLSKVLAQAPLPGSPVFFILLAAVMVMSAYYAHQKGWV